MATLKKGSKDIILRELSGKLGNVVVRQCKGKTVICSLPRNNPGPQTPLAKQQINKFRTASIFANFLLGIVPVKEAWKQAKMNTKNVQNKIIKCNIKSADPNQPTIKTFITPPSFDFLISDILLCEEHVSIIFAHCFEPENNDSLIMILALMDPDTEESNPFHLVNISPAVSDDFCITLNEDQMTQFLKYNKFIIYTAVIRQNKDGVQWSNTIALEGDIDHCSF